MLIFTEKHIDFKLRIGKGLFSWVRTPKSGDPEGGSLAQLKEALDNVCVIKTDRLALQLDLLSLDLMSSHPNQNLFRRFFTV